MRIAITGASGFIGSRLAQLALQQGHEVRVLGQANNDREKANRGRLERLGVQVVEGSVLQPAALRALVAGADTVFHLAAAQHEANVPDRHFWDVNVEGTRHMLDAAVAAQVGRFVHGSTIGVYGAALNGELDEDSPVSPDNIYGVTKLEGERLALSYADRLPVTVIRISETYGPGDGRLLKLFKAIAKGAFFMVGAGRNKHQVIFVDDLIEGLFRAAREDKAIGQVFTLAGEEILSTRDMVSAVAAAVGTRAPRFSAPLWPFLLTAVAMEHTLRPLGIQPPLHRRRLDFFRKSFYFNQRKAREVLDFRPATTFAAGARRTAAWYRENGWL